MGGLPAQARRLTSAAGDGGNDAHLITGAGRRRQAVEETHILAVEIDVHEVAQLTGLVAQPLLDSRKLGSSDAITPLSDDPSTETRS